MPPIPRRLKEDGRPVKAIGLISGGLVVDTMPAEDADYLWVPNTAESTVSRWDARTATEVVVAVTPRFS